MTKQAKPFLKWVGGKGQLINDIVSLLPTQFNDYFEPFIGGGAVFFSLYSQGLLKNKAATLLDFNDELINTYSVLKQAGGVTKVVKLLSGEKYANTSENFYMIRAEVPTNKYERAARMIYLNKTCFNGLYRVNGSGKFNTPFGKYANPTICDIDNLKACGKALQGVSLVSGSYDNIKELAKKGDLIYFDPPYQPVSKTANFTGYTKNAFGEKDQESLAALYSDLDKRGCHLMLSNSDAPLILELYKKFDIHIVKAKRAINCNANNRGKVNEVIVTNY
jgi:DNA adenine methylase